MSKKSSVKIGTHDGYFLCSDVLACVLLKLLPQYKDASIVRSQNQSVLDTCDIVVGVGGKYDPSRHRYDQYIRKSQESVSTVMKNLGCNWTEKLSSAGLIYCHFGREILRSVLSDVTEDGVIDEIFEIIYDTLIKEIDAVTNHKQMCRSNTDLSARVSRLNCRWYSQNMNLNFEKQFEKAMALVREEFLEIVRSTKNIWLPAIDIVQHALENRFKVDSSGEIIALSQYVPYKEYLIGLEENINVSPLIKYVIFGNKNLYWVECMPGTLKSSVYKMLLPKAWGGLRTDALVEACGIEGAVFVSAGRHIGAHKTKDGAMAMARKALKIGKTMQGVENDDV